MKIPQTYLDDTAAQARLDHLHAETKRVGMERLGEWRGFEATYWFRCPKNHEVKRYLRFFTTRSTMPECPSCLLTQRTQRLRTKAKDAGITLVSRRWLGNEAQHKFRCAQGHQWERSGLTALANMACPHCTKGRPRQASLRPDGLKQLQSAATKRGGECLSQEYLGLLRKHQFRCAEGHVWQALGDSILKGLWCPRCGHKLGDRAIWQEDGLARLHAAAASKGGECLANEFKGGKAYYRFRCSKGHEWETRGQHVIERTWCKVCNVIADRLGIDEARHMANERGGQCLSNEYVNSRQKLHWLCHRGHSWHSAFSNIRAGHWCPTCYRISRLTSAKSKVRQRYESYGRPKT
jgi:hypothetical protein